jgi:transglutaminase-like putative cysteine protease
MKPKLCILIFSLGLFTPRCFSQESPQVKFGEVSSRDFATTIYSIDSNASAVIIADMGSTKVVGNSKGGFSLEFKNYRRAQVLTKSGYDISSVTIGIYTEGEAEEKLSKLRAVTYNLQDGEVIETKLEPKSSVFENRINKNWVIKTFTFPNVKEGSIIEYEYTLRSDFLFNLKSWEFQGEFPRLWSEYKVTVPEFYYYVTMTQGYLPFYIKEQKGGASNFNVSDDRSAGASNRSNFTAGITEYRWVMKDVPALKEESYTSTLSNHIAKIEFQLSELRYPLTPKNVMATWPETCEDLLKDEDFGYQLSRDNPWLNDVMGVATRGAANDLEKAKNIYAYIRDNMTCTNYNRTRLEQPLKNILKNRNGSEAEINLLLIAMLRKAGLNADPVILSTRSHGYAYAEYPLMDRFNYVISKTTIDGQTYYLDASEPRMGFGKLGYQCYNGHARVINPDATALELDADSLLERKTTSVLLVSDTKGNLSGSVQQSPGYFESANLRDRIKEKGKDQLFIDIKKAFNADIEIRDAHIDSLDNYEDPVTIRYDFWLKQENEEIIYFNPMFGEGYKENPFKSSRRLYPVEMPYTIDETYLLQLQVPEGYMVDELPKQVLVKLNTNDDGMFEYLISEFNGTISLRSRLQIRRSYFQPDEYEKLREFFGLVVKKHNEQIVFKKKQ